MPSSQAYFGLINTTLSGEQLAGHATELAAQAICKPNLGKTRSALQFINDSNTILMAYKRFRRALKAGQTLPVAADEFIDSFYIIEKNLTGLKYAVKNIPQNKLPLQNEGAHINLPRAYSIAVSLVGDTGGYIDEASLAQFLDAYERVSPLTMAEVASLLPMLKLAVIRLIRMQTQRIEAQIEAATRGEALALSLLKLSDEDKTLSQIIKRADFEKNPEKLERFISVLYESDRLDLIDAATKILLHADINIDNALSAQKQTHLKMAERMNRAVASLRFLDVVDTNEFFERFSIVETTLRSAEFYADMDAASRAYYRQEVERNAALLDVAQTAVAKCAVNLSKNRNGRAKDVGYFLFSKGRAELFSTLRPDKPIKQEKIWQQIYTFVLLELSIFAILSVALGVLNIIYWLLSIIPVWHISRYLCVKIMMLKKHVRFIPRLSLAQGVPAHAKTLVVIPVLICSEGDVLSAAKNLEAHYLNSRLNNVAYAVLSDYADSKMETMPKDGELLRMLLSNIKMLNERYNTDVFHVLQRKRTYFAPNDLYMGWERKRGALMELVRYIETGDEGSIAVISSPLPHKIKYCLTLDADTVLPHGALRTLIGAMEHPLNKPVKNENGIVEKGYGILAPKMQQTLFSAAKTKFSRMNGAFAGADLYSSCASEFYQDVFASGLFGGKGMFDVSIFYETLKDMLPENTILSHDMLEGCFLRAGYISDVTLYDGEPSTIAAWWKRQHRWMRGDWQLFPYINNLIRNAKGERVNNPLSPLSKLKIIDNLRRTMLFGAVLYIILAAPFLGQGIYIFVGLLALYIDLAFDFIYTLLKQVFRADTKTSFFGAILDKRHTLCSAYLTLATLPYSAAMCGDAMQRTLYRLFVSKKNMLQWQTASQIKNKGGSFLSYALMLWQCVLAGAYFVVTAALGYAPVYSIIFAVIFLSALPLSYYLDKPLKKQVLNKNESTKLAEYAKRTWQFFTTFCTEENNYLPPDNFQTAPFLKIVKNTSPTNIGMAIVAYVCANELGFIDYSEMKTRISNTISTLERMEKWNGHIYNWYDIKTLAPLYPKYVSTVDSGNLAAALLLAATAIKSKAQDHVYETEKLADRIMEIAKAMDFSKLYDKKKKLFHIGFDAKNFTLSGSWYDLFASESRLTSLVAIALGQVEAEHWQRLLRLLVDGEGGRTLVSWSGTMFEYLMPLIFTGAVYGSLQENCCTAALNAQILAVNSRMPWGISESGYYAFDSNMLYQYRAFGVPQIALAQFRTNELVISPYSSMLALSIKPKIAMNNLKRLENAGAVGKYGFFEAVDYTQARLRADTDSAIVKSFMAHHQGMSLAAATNALKDNVLQKLFLSVPQIYASRMLLEEQRPRQAECISAYRSDNSAKSSKQRFSNRVRVVDASQQNPCSQILSNGEYNVFLADNGNSYSQYKDVFLTRFYHNENVLEQGIRFVIKDNQTTWTAEGVSSHPETKRSRAIFEQHKVCYETLCSGVSSNLTISVHPNIMGEVRTLRLVNETQENKTLEVGVFVDVALAKQSEEDAQAAFSRLCIGCLEVGNGQFIFNKRSLMDEKYAFAGINSEYRQKASMDRLSFLGRGNSLEQAMQNELVKKNTNAPIAEPGLCVRLNVPLNAGESTEITFVFGYAEDKERAMESINSLLAAKNDVTELAWAQAVGSLRVFGLNAEKAELFENIAYHIITRQPQMKTCMKKRGHNGIFELWSVGVSGDYPIIVTTISNEREINCARTLIELHNYLSNRGIKTDLLLIGEYENDYCVELRSKLEAIISTSGKHGITLLHGYILSDTTKAAIFDLSFMTVDAKRGLKPIQTQKIDAEQTHLPEKNKKLKFAQCNDGEDLLFFNGIGGFEKNGEYVMRLSEYGTALLPWCNVLANRCFGTITSECGNEFTWHGNAQQRKLTPWKCNVLSSNFAEGLLLFDKQTHEPFSPFFSCMKAHEKKVRHGMGKTEYRIESDEFWVKATVFVDVVDPVKFTLLEIYNKTNTPKNYGIICSTNWVLGERQHNEAITQNFTDNAVFAQNMRDNTHEEAFLALCGTGRVEAGFSLDETFLNYAGTWESAACGKNFAALRGSISVLPHKSGMAFVALGETLSADALQLTKLAVIECEARLRNVEAHWQTFLSKIRIESCDTALNLMANYWLPYQTMSSRILARTGYYQNGGAIGFRDQLQDMLAILWHEPDLVRKHVLKCAAHQFIKGDVLHWWHEPMQGVRTKIVDDRLFLPLVASEYAVFTGDYTIFEQSVAYLDDVPINDGEKDVYGVMQPSNEFESLYMHCKRAILSTLELGVHGLPKMGGGDWNDGMDRVGEGGGESCWLGMFLVYVLEKFAAVSEKMGERNDANVFVKLANELRKTLEDVAYANDRYLRSFLDDGSALGAKGNENCEIDLLCQAWAGIIELKNADEALNTAYIMLTDEQNGIIKLLHPPFSSPDSKIGYITNYSEGVRENGGQYTHAAVWFLKALIKRKKYEDAKTVLNWLNPILKADTKEKLHKYKAEPYVVAADVYEGGRGGWTHYTGAAGWLYQVIVKDVFGLRRMGSTLTITPTPIYERYRLTINYGCSEYVFNVISTKNAEPLTLELNDDGEYHEYQL